MKKFINLSLLTLLFAAIFSACNTNNPDGPKSDENIIPAQSIKSDKSITLFVDSTYKINVTVTPAEANEPLVWSSDNSNVATVNQQGVVTAISDGTCNISVSSGPLTAATKVTVINNPVTLELELYSVEQKKCTVTVVPSDEKGYYYCSYAYPEDLEGLSDAEIIDILFNYLLQMADQYAAYGYKLADLLQSGSKNLIASGLTANTEYVMLAFGIDADYKVASPKLARLPFKTAEVETSDMTIEIKYDSTTVTTSGTTTETKLWFSATPSNDDPYVFNGTTDLEKEFGSAQEFLEYIEKYYDTNYSSYGGIEAFVKTGASSMYAKNPKDGAIYTLVAAGYKGGWTTKPFTLKYEYKAATAEGMPARLVPYKEKLDNCVELKPIEKRPFLRNACY
jgi:hypothetical protein